MNLKVLSKSGGVILTAMATRRGLKRLVKKNFGHHHFHSRTIDFFVNDILFYLEKGKTKGKKRCDCCRKKVGINYDFRELRGTMQRYLVCGSCFWLNDLNFFKIMKFKGKENKK